MSTQTTTPEEQEDKSSGKSDKSGLFVVCNGAECVCDQSNEGTKAILKVLSQTKIYVNDKEGAEKLVANTNDLGIPFEVPVQTFGTCKMQPTGTSYMPCIPNIVQWKDPYEAIVLDNMGQALVDDSEGTCAFGGKITFETHGQTQTVTQQDAEAATNDMATLVNPALTEEDVHELIAGQFTTSTEDKKGASVKSIKTEDDKYAYHYTKPDISFSVKQYSSSNLTKEQKAGINWAVFYKGEKDKEYKEVGKYPDKGERFNFPFQTQGTFIVEAYGGKKGPYFIKNKNIAAYKKITLSNQTLTGITGPFVGKEDRTQYKRVRPDETVTIKANLLFNQKDLKTALSGKKHMKGVVWEAKAYQKRGKTKVDVPVEIIKDKNNLKQISIAPLGNNANVTVTATNPDTGAGSSLSYTVGSNYVIRVQSNKETISVWDGKEQKKQRHQVTLEVAKYAIEPARQIEKDAVRWTSFCLGEKPNTNKIIATGHSTVQILQEEAEMIYEAYGIRPTGGESQSTKKVTGILPKITKAYWADKKGNKIHRSGFKHEVYIHIETEGLTGEKLKLNVWESDNNSDDDFIKNAGTDIEITAKNGVIHQAFTLPESHYLEQEYFFTIQELPCIVAGTKQDGGCNNEYVLWANHTDKKTHYLYVNKDKKIVNLRMYEDGSTQHTGIIKYGDSITVKVETRNYVGENLLFNIYEDINWAIDPQKDETISIPIDSQGKGEAKFTVPTSWEPDHKDSCVPRYFYLEHNGEEFPRSFYIKAKGKEENKIESKPRVRALMLKVSTTLELDEQLEADNAVVLGSELPKAFVEHMKLLTGGRAPWMEIAIEQAKLAKGVDEEFEPMYSMAKSYLRFVGNTHEPTDGVYGPWCASFMNWCMNESGNKYAKSASSLAPIHQDFQKKFKKIDEPIYGCIVVYKHISKWKGHTGFLYGMDSDGKYLLLGGNQRDTIKLSAYGEYTSKSKKKKLYGFYVPIDYKISSSDYLTEKDLNLNIEEENKKIGVLDSKDSGKTT